MAKYFTITGTVVHSIKDRYKFNPGEQFPPVTPITTADELNLLEKCRGANQFNQDASWTQTLQARGSLNSLLDTAGNPNAKVWVWTGP